MKPFKSKWADWRSTTPKKPSDKTDSGTSGTPFLRGILAKTIGGISLIEYGKGVDRQTLSEVVNGFKVGTAFKMWSDKVQDFIFVTASEEDRKTLIGHLPKCGVYNKNEVHLLMSTPFSSSDLNLIHEIKKQFSAVISEVKNLDGEVPKLTGTGRKADT